MIRSWKIHIPGVGGPIVETTIDASFEGASRQIGLEVANDFRPEASPQTTLLISVLSSASGELLAAVIGVLG